MLFFVVEKQTKINEEKTSEKRFEKKKVSKLIFLVILIYGLTIAI